MRCRECNIDVAENVTRCPLCGAKVFDDAPLLPELGDIPYPQGVSPAPKEKREITPFTVAKYAARAAVVGGGALNAVGRIAKKEKLVSTAATVSAVSGAAALYSCLAEKGELMKGALPLLTDLAAAASCALPCGKKHTANRTALAATAACAAFLAAAYSSAPDKMREQFKAAFRIRGEQK